MPPGNGEGTRRGGHRARWPRDALRVDWGFGWLDLWEGWAGQTADSCRPGGAPTPRYGKAVRYRVRRKQPTLRVVPGGVGKIVHLNSTPVSIEADAVSAPRHHVGELQLGAFTR